MDADEALAVAFANLKGSKDKDLLGTARALATLKALPEYRSNTRVGAAVGVSGEIVREFLTLLRFPPEVQERFATGDLGLEHGRRLWQLGRHRSELVPEAAQKMVGMTAMDARHMVDQLIRYPATTVEEAARQVVAAKPIVEREYHVIALLDEQQYRSLVRAARSQSLPPDELVTQIVRDWLSSSPEDRR